MHQHRCKLTPEQVHDVCNQTVGMELIEAEHWLFARDLQVRVRDTEPAGTKRKGTTPAPVSEQYLYDDRITLTCARGKVINYEVG